jgi:ribonuclease BN (tRNA processing enzyme)
MLVTGGSQPAMFALTFLGTSASVPSAERNHPALLVEAGSHRILVDCGEGTQRQLLRSGAGFRRLDRLLLTHGHLDHVLGIPGLFSTLRLRQSADVMTIHASPVTLEVVAGMLAGLWGEGRAPIPLELVPLATGQVIDGGEFTIACFPVRHRRPTASVSRLKARLVVTFGGTASPPSVCQTVQCARSWRKEDRRHSRMAEQLIPKASSVR